MCLIVSYVYNVLLWIIVWLFPWLDVWLWVIVYCNVWDIIVWWSLMFCDWLARCVCIYGEEYGFWFVHMWSRFIDRDLKEFLLTLCRLKFVSRSLEFGSCFGSPSLVSAWHFYIGLGSIFLYWFRLGLSDWF